jgi:hypothetical protein
LTIASGVHGMIDLAVPGGGSSLSTTPADAAEGTLEERSDCGSMKRMLHGLVTRRGAG